MARSRTCKFVDFDVPADHRIKLKESEKKDKYLDPARELKKNMEHKSYIYTNYEWCFCYSHQRIIKGTGWLGGRRTNGDHPNYSIIENGQNNNKNFGDLRRFAITQTSVKDHQLMRMWKTVKCRRCGDRDETINHIISECSKLAQRENKARRDWVGKVIHWEMSKKSKFDHTNKWYMHNPAPVLENAAHKLLWDFNIQTDHLIPARRQDLIIISKKKKKKKENLQNSRLCCPGWPQNKTERIWKEG